MHRPPAPRRWFAWPLLLAAFPAAAEVRDAAAAGFTVENARTVAGPPDAVWQALVGEVDRWWSKDHSWWGAASRLTLDARAGGCFCETGADGRQAMHMQVVFVDPGRTLRLTGGLGPLQGMGLHGAMEWRLEPAEGGTRVTLHYRAGGYVPGGLEKLAPAVDGVLALQLERLAAHLAPR